MEHGLPFVRVKLAMSLDAHRHGQRGKPVDHRPRRAFGGAALRARSSVVLSGADTLLADDARLNVRPDELGLNAELTALAAARQPLRVLVDEAPAGAAGIGVLPGRSGTGGDLRRRLGARTLPGRRSRTAGAASAEGHVDLHKLLLELAARGNGAGGGRPRLAGAFARLGLVDEYRLFVAPKFLGSSARPLLDWPLAQMADAAQLRIDDIRAVGDDWLVTARIRGQRTSLRGDAADDAQAAQLW